MSYIAGYEDSEGNEYYLSDTLHANKWEAQKEVESCIADSTDLGLNFFVGETTALKQNAARRPEEDERHLY